MGHMSDLKRTLCGGVFIAMLAPGAAFAGDRIGLLECHLSGNGVRVLVENQDLDCVYQDEAEGVPPQHYVGKLTKVGANLTFNGPGDLVWGVLAATRTVGPGALAGQYAGPEATVKVGVGGGGAILVGGSNNTLSLQPFNVEEGTGIGVTAGVESLTLAFVPDQPPPPMKHRHLVGAVGHLIETVGHTKEAIAHGKQGHADALVTHAEAALNHAKAAETARNSKHTKEGIVHLNAAIEHGKQGHAEVATKHAEAALVHFDAALAQDHLLEAIGHTREAIKHGKLGHADVLVTHAEAALDHAEASEKAKANPHTEEGVTHLKEAIEHGKLGHADVATKHAETALQHLEEAK